MKAINKILLWGFYEQGNLGDDLMAVMVAEMVKSINKQPVIFSSNPRFKKMGYDTINSLGGSIPEAILLSGGAFFKSSNDSKSKIESSISSLADYIEEVDVPVIGLSLGSDGIESLDEMSVARRRVIRNKNFVGSTLRLKKDLSLGLPNSIFLPDIVFATKYFRKSYLTNYQTSKECKYNNKIFLNLSRRSALYLPLVHILFYKEDKVFFLAHSGKNKMGGELNFSIFPTVQSDDIVKAIDNLGEVAGIASSKLHPGIMALSMGRKFYSVRPRPKTINFINEYQGDVVTCTTKYFGIVRTLEMIKSDAWQENLWMDYISFILKMLSLERNKS